eukprot:10575122-Prorocentrum_lima.AAC.1
MPRIDMGEPGLPAASLIPQHASASAASSSFAMASSSMAKPRISTTEKEKKKAGDKEAARER